MAQGTKQRRTWAVKENLVMAYESLRDRWFRSILTIVGVLIGVVIIMGVASVLNGFRQGVVDRFARFGTNNVYVTRFPMIMMDRPSSEIRRRRALTLKDAWSIRAECPAVAAVSPEKMGGAPSVKFGEREMLGPEVHGAFADARDVVNLRIEDGRFYTAEENIRRMPVCVVGYNIINTLFPHTTVIGKIITLKGRRLRVIGVLERAANGDSDEEDPSDSMIFVPYYLFKEMFPWGDDHFISVRAREGRLREALEQIEEVLRRRRHVAWNKPNDFELETFSSMVASFDKITAATMAVMFALSTVAFMVGGVGVMNVMFASVKERTREIGVRRALGARRRDITWQFLAEAIAMTGVGGLVGVALGEGMMRTLIYFLPNVPCSTPMWARLFGFLGSMGVGLVFGLWPAIQAARLDPIKALRYE